MWLNRDQLDYDLGDNNIERAEDTAVLEYQQLIEKSTSWWELLRMFKMQTFPLGLGVNVAREFGGRAEIESGMSHGALGDTLKARG
jgi:hypothetical protein